MKHTISEKDASGTYCHGCSHLVCLDSGLYCCTHLSRYLVPAAVIHCEWKAVPDTDTELID